MSIVRNPPTEIVGYDSGESEFIGVIKVYLNYDYLPIRNISIIMKSVNELYELVYSILNDESVPEEDKLVLKLAATGNSFEWVGQVLSQFTSTRAKVAILVAAGLIYTPIGIERYRTSEANRHYIYAQTDLTIANAEKTKAEIEKIKAETAKIKSEKQSVDLENLYKEQKLKKDSIAKLNSEQNKKRLMRKRSSLRRAAEHPAIHSIMVNNINIFIGK